MKRMEVKLIWVLSHLEIRENEQAKTVWYGFRYRSLLIYGEIKCMRIHSNGQKVRHAEPSRNF